MRNRDTQREIILKRHKNNNKAGIKLSGAILSIWEMAGKNLSVPHSQQDWWKSSQPTRCTYNLQPDLLGSFPADIIGQFGCGHRAKFSPSAEGGEKSFWQIVHIRIPAILDTKSSQTPWIACFPATLYFQGHLIFPKSPNQQKFARRTDILRNTSIVCPWRKSRMVMKFGPYILCRFDN